MSKSKSRKEAIRKAKRKKRIIYSVVITAAVLLIAAVIVFAVQQQRSARVYSDGSQSVTLNANGKFSAALSHDVKKSGKYTETTSGGVTTITFTSSGTSADGKIENDILSIPLEWADDHGHGTELALTKGKK